MIWLRGGSPALILAPMEGVTDAPMRALLTEQGGFSFCVSEFFRVSQDVPHSRAFAHHVPEARQGWKTPAGLPVQLQLLGGDPEKLAETAARAVATGAPAIDLNFGCPAPTVNRHDGGASLLRSPQRIRAIVAAVRAAVPPAVAVSAKLRLGWDCLDSIHENAERAAEGGASWITIHGRTKTQGYRPPAYWKPIGEVARRLSIPVVANGEIWSLEDLRRCRDETGCEHFMLGRGALGNPLLPLLAARELGLACPDANTLDWPRVLTRFAALCAGETANANYALCRIKQWLRMVAPRSAAPWGEGLGRARTLDEFFAVLRT